MKRNNILLGLLIVFALSSCRFYKSTSLNAPVLEQKGEINLGVATISSTDVNASYAITDNLAAMASYGDTYSIETETTVNGETVKDKLTNNKYEAGFGYYDKTDNDLFYNVFVGYASGNSGSFLDDIFTTDPSTGEDEDVGLGAKFSGPFIQSGLHILSGDDAFVGFVGRLNYFTFTDFKNTATFDAGTVTGQGDETTLIGQLGLDFQLKGEKFGGGTQLSYTFHNNDQDYFTARKFNIHFGVYLRVDALFR